MSNGYRRRTTVCRCLTNTNRYPVHNANGMKLRHGPVKTEQSACQDTLRMRMGPTAKHTVQAVPTVTGCTFITATLHNPHKTSQFQQSDEVEYT